MAVVAAGVGYVLYRYDQIRKVHVANLVPEVSGQPINILLIGNNCRSCLNGTQTGAFGSGSEVGGGRSDVTMVLHLVPKTRSISIVSIPRDTWLPQPGQPSYEERVDAELNKGPSALIATIEQDLGIPINRFVELNFDSFQNVVNALGGIDMYFPTRMYDAYSGLNVPGPGCYHLNGFQALAVVRARHLEYGSQLQYYDPTGDISRIHRDHEFLKVLGAELQKQGIFNISTLNAVLGSVAPQLTVDSGFSITQMISLALTFRSVNPASAPTATLPVYEYPQPYYYDGFDDGDVVFPTEPFDEQVLAEELGIVPPPVEKGLPVEVLNGTGAPGQASQLAGELAGLGYRVVGTGNDSQPTSFAETVVYYRPGYEAQAETLVGHLVGEVAMGEHPLPAGVDLQVVTGSGMLFSATPAVAPVVAGHTATSAPTTVPATSTTAPPLVPAPTPTTVPTTSPGSFPGPGGMSEVTTAHEPLPWFDPRACPSGMTAKPLPS